MATRFLIAQNDTVWYRVCTGCTSVRTEDDPSGIRYSYGVKTAFITEDIISDYGVRNVNGGSRFHQAIDYTVYGNGNNDKGDAIVSITAGNNKGIKKQITLYQHKMKDYAST